MKLTEIQQKFIAIAIEMQTHQNLLLDERDPESEFLDNYGFTKDELNKALEDLKDKLQASPKTEEGKQRLENIRVSTNQLFGTAF